MIATVRTSPNLQGKIQVPASKSHSVRVLFAAALKKGDTIIHNLDDNEDTQAALDVIRALGCTVEGETIHGTGLPFQVETNEMFTGNSGITTRFLLPLLGLRHSTHPIRVIPNEQMRARPSQPLVSALNGLGMDIQVDKGVFNVQGRIRGGHAEISGLSSQYTSALLFALSWLPENSTLKVHNLNEKPYVQLTLDWLVKMGAQITWRADDTFEIEGGKTPALPDEITIPRDWSAASCLLLLKNIQLEGLDPSDPQPDKILADWLKQDLSGRTLDLNDCPDLVPAVAVLATQIPGGLTLANVPQARIKETDRIHSMAEGLRAMGAAVEELPDGLKIAQTNLKGAKIHGYHDHRTVMAFTVAGLLAEGATEIDTAEAVAKTYPNFFKDLQACGANITLE